jgi:hypothetical protein
LRFKMVFEHSFPQVVTFQRPGIFVTSGVFMTSLTKIRKEIKTQ